MRVGQRIDRSSLDARKQSARPSRVERLRPAPGDDFGRRLNESIPGVDTALVGGGSVPPAFGILGPLEVTVHFVQRLFVVSAAVSFVGCASFGTPENAQTPGRASFALPVWTTDGMYFVSGRAGALFLAASPPEWRHYRGVVVDDIEISTKDRSRDLTPYEEERLRGYFTRRLEKVFRSNGWPIVETPGEDVLRLRLAVRELELRRPRDSHFGTIIVGPSSTKITIVLELRDPVTSDRRLLFGDKRALPFGSYAGSSSVSIRRIEDAFYEFSIDIRRRLAEVQRGAFPPPPRPS